MYEVFLMDYFFKSFTGRIRCQLSVVSCQWSVVSCRWSVVGGQLSVVSCRWSVVGYFLLPIPYSLIDKHSLLSSSVSRS
jgi:hypothetical protein